MLKMKDVDIFQLAHTKIQEEADEFAVTDETRNGLFTLDELQKALNSQQDGDAWLFVQIHRYRFCFDHTTGNWFNWAGHYWVQDFRNEVLAVFDAIIDQYGWAASQMAWRRLKLTKEGKSDEAKKTDTWERRFLDRIADLQTLGRKKSILTLAAAGARGLGITGQEWDRRPYLLGCTNGVLELKVDLLFRPGRQSDFIKTVSPTEWIDLSQPAPIWEQTLADVFDGDAELIAYIQRLLGYALTGSCTEHVLPIFYGRGRNGKGTILQAIADVLGELAGPVQAEMLLDQGRARSSAGPSADIMSLRGRCIAWASETDEGRKLNAGKVKWLVGGDTLVGREPYARREVSFKPSHTLFLLTNHKPKADADDFALWQRIHLIPFTQSFIDRPTAENEKQRNPKLAEKLKTEAPGILAWMVRGFLAWQKEGLNPPSTVVNATKNYRMDEDLLGQFVCECCVVTQYAMTKAGALRKAYEQWCNDNGYHPVSGNKFSKYLLNHFDRDDSGRHRIYLGVGLKAGQQDEN